MSTKLTAPTGRARSLDAFSELVHRIYDAGIHPERWIGAVAAIVDSMGASKGLLFTPTLAPQHGGLIFPHGITEKSLQAWGTHYIDKDIWHREAQRKQLTKERNVYTDGDLVPQRTFLASPFYREFLTTMDIRRVCGGVVFEQAPGLPETVLSVFRGKDAAAFSTDDRSWMHRLLPHLSRSLGLMQRLEMHRVQKASTHAAFDRMPFGIMLLNEARKVLHLNKSAVQVVARRDGLAVNAAGMLEGQGVRAETGTLQAWLARFADRAESDPAHFSDSFAVLRDKSHGTESRHYMLQCAPVASEGSWDVQDGEARFVVFITDPAALTLPAAQRLRELYGLTGTQASIALEFARGHSYREVGRRLLISEETVRSHVKEIYPRLRVNRQADLVRLVLSLAQVRI